MIYDGKSDKNHQQATHPELNAELKQSCHTCPKAIFSMVFSPKTKIVVQVICSCNQRIFIRKALCLTLNLLTVLRSPCPTPILCQNPAWNPNPSNLLHPSNPTEEPARLSRIPSRWPGIYHLRLSTPQREKGKEGGFLVMSFGGRKR